MITIRPAVPEELPQLKDLWRKCFGDPSTYVDIFYQKFCPVEQVLVVDEVGELDSMAAMLPGTVHLPDGTDIPVGYVYALATNPYMQGKGHARQLLKYADEYLQKRGDKAMILVPASPSLHRFFETVGMDECFATRKVEFLASSLTGDTGGGVMTPVAPREYNEIRESYLKDTFHVTYSDNMVTFQQIGSHMAYGDLYKTRWAAWSAARPLSMSRSAACWPKSCSSPTPRWARPWRPSPRRWRLPATTSAPRLSGTACPAATPRPSA